MFQEVKSQFKKPTKPRQKTLINRQTKKGAQWYDLGQKTRSFLQFSVPKCNSESLNLEQLDSSLRERLNCNHHIGHKD